MKKYGLAPSHWPLYCLLRLFDTVPLMCGLSAIALLGGMGLYVVVAGALMGDKSVTLWFVGIIASTYLIFGILQPILIVWIHNIH